MIINGSFQLTKRTLYCNIYPFHFSCSEILNKPVINVNIDVYGDVTSYLDGSRYRYTTLLWDLNKCLPVNKTEPPRNFHFSSTSL